MQVSAKHKLYGITQSATFSIKTGETKTGVECKYDSRAVVTGTVRNQQGEPLKGALVKFWESEEQIPEEFRRGSRERAFEGSFQLPDAEGIEWKKAHAHLSREERNALLKKENESGKEMRWTDNYVIYRADIYDESEYSLVLSHDASLSAMAYVPGYKKKVLDNIKVKVGETVVRDFILEKAEKVLLEGIVVDENDNPVQGISVQLYNNIDLLTRNHTLMQVDSDENGFFSFDAGE